MLKHSKFCLTVQGMLHDFIEERAPEGVFTPLSHVRLHYPDDELLDQLDKERTYKWYSDFDEGFYSELSYLWDTFYYYKAFSVDNIKPLRKFLSHPDEAPPKSVYDFGGGLGMTTVQLATMMPEAEVFYSNVPGAQRDFAQLLFDRFAPNVTVIDVDEAPKVEMLAFLDVLEHIREPFDIVRRLVDDSTRVVLDSSAFGRMAAGHQVVHIDCGKILPSRKFKRRWGETAKDYYFDMLDQMGFTRWDKVNYGWNAMPVILTR